MTADHSVPPRRIFRPAALERYARQREEGVLPRVVTPGTFRVLWLVLALLLGSSVAAYKAVADVLWGG